MEFINKTWKALVSTVYRLGGSSFSGNAIVSSSLQYVETISVAPSKFYSAGNWAISPTL